MTNDMDSFLMHYGVKGQKKGMRRYQNEDGSYTAEGREHYGIGDGRRIGSPKVTNASSIRKLVSSSNGKKEVSKKAAENTNSKKKNTGKKIAIAGAATAAAVAGFVAYRKATKLRDVMRSNAHDEANRWFSRKISLMQLQMRNSDNAIISRSHANTERRMGKHNVEKFDNDNMHSYMRDARAFSKRMKEAAQNHDEYKRLSTTLTRRDAVKTYLRDKSLTSKRATKKAQHIRNINAINARLRNYGVKDLLPIR